MSSQDEDSLLPPPPKVSGGKRYVEREGRNPWSLQEDLVIWPFLTACGRLSTYGQTCRWLCEALFRPPVEPQHAHWRLDDWYRESISIIERRTVTEVLTGQSNVPGRYLLLIHVLQIHEFGVQAGSPFSWAEKTRILWPYFRNTNNSPRIALSELMRFMGRNTKDATAAERWYAQIMAGGGNFDKEQWTDHDPHIKLKEDKYLTAITNYTKTHLEDHEALRLAWWQVIQHVGT